MDLREHLTRSFEDGGHGFENTGYVITDLHLPTVHDDDHYPKACWAEVITHTHD